MDLIDRLHELAARIKRQRDHVLTEEAAKTAFVLPFIQALGYDVFNPAEVIPELTADHGVKKGEKVDYAIKQGDKITILIECKPLGAELEARHASQLFRYFSVTDARFGVLTDGIRYVFFSDLDRANRMDDRPFFEIDVLNFTEDEVDQIKNFSREAFDLDTIISTASNLKYHRALLAEFRQEYEAPSEDLVRIMTARVYSGRITQQVKEQFSTLTRQAFHDFVRDKVNSRLKSALNTEDGAHVQIPPESTEVVRAAPEAVEEDGIITTEEERKAFRIIQAIGAEIVDVGRIAMRDAKSYCAILLDDNNRRPICRFYFLKTKMAMTVFAPEGEKKADIERLEDIYKLRSEVRAAIRQYDEAVVGLPPEPASEEPAGGVEAARTGSPTGYDQL